MKAKFGLPLLIFFVLSYALQAQKPVEYFVSGNANLYLPFSSEKGMFPILGYDKDTKPKVLIGGFGAGFAALKNIKKRTSLKGQINLSRSVYWESFVFTNNVAAVTGQTDATSTDYTLGLLGTFHLHLSPAFSMGTGIGTQVLIASYLNLREDALDDGSVYIGRNRFYKPVMPTIPIELTWRFKKMFVNLRYEHGLLDRFKNDLAEDKTDKYGLLFFEFGIKVK
jgi:hypothetical protein